MSSFPSRKRRISKLESDSHSELLSKRLTLDLDKDILLEETNSGLRLASQVFSKHDFTTKKNAVLSPLSIHIALSMVAAGAAGAVKEEIISFIGAKSDEQLHNFASKVTDVILSDSSASGGPKLSAANAVWLKDSLTFKSSFKKTMKTDYKAVTKLLDFTKVGKSVRKVNKWAEKVTNGLIKDVVSSDSMDSETVLVLANALYFKGSWVDNFEPKDTEDDAFHLMDGSSARVPFMSSRKSRPIGTYDTFKVLNLPYRGGEDGRSFSMSIFLPNDRDGLPSLLQRVCTEGTNFLDRHIPKREVTVGKLRVPKFKIEVNVDVMDVLEQLGLKIGMLTEMVEGMLEPLVTVSNITHKAFVEVNEEGTEAAAVTTVHRKGCCRFRPVQVEYVDFIADHPFMFVIRENWTGLVLFVGWVLDPTS